MAFPTIAHDQGTAATRLMAYARPRLDVFESHLERVLTPSRNVEDILNKAMRYATLAQGAKRIRPLLCMMAHEACGGSFRNVLQHAAAIELIHASSLIHDDLPAMDNSPMRRGRASCHMCFGDGVTVVAGDALLARAFELMAEGVKTISPSTQLSATRVLAAAIGANGMASGQVADLHGSVQTSEIINLEFIHTQKTGSFIAACLEIGALLTDAPEAQLKALRIFGNAIGLAYQISDDILDQVGHPEELGKPCGQDAKLGRATYPGLLGLERSRRLLERFVEEGHAAISDFGPSWAPLRLVGDYLLERQWGTPSPLPA